MFSNFIPILLHRSSRILDIKPGIASFRDREVPLSKKAFALSLGAALTIALMAIEFPLESLLAGMIIGMPIDISMDGLEAVFGPVLFACVILPRLLNGSKKNAAQSGIVHST